MKIKKLFILLILSLFVIFTPAFFVFAQEKTDEATSSSGSLKDIMKNADLGKVNGAINNLLNKKVAMIGEVTRITDESITITNLSGIKILDLSNNPKIIKDSKEIAVDKIEVENWVTVLGQVEDDEFISRLIYVSATTLRPKTQEVMIGTITSITNSEVKVRTRSRDEEKTLKLSKSTSYQDSDGEKANINSFSKDINILVTGTNNEISTTALTLRSLAPLSDE
ncbi:MAG: hypothetical protein COZ34_05155 [Candidatus Pacebacteria bacterium CG_4_10_14_3_um_filter_34_15]|nr:hypothetical protein [Candidatus Pacearchaeota archaeon]NCQ65431.1 hypothetical protein [Candidatus Paceibacterota bacterium]OIO44191.1 MAG: hypothetical protein AUJ41_03335 [Candidatus Pacebacteria bacterium CG1_02_43_31]PIQ80811.1 MAG: hypothetical protein COV78_03910 [Candidatus Pacebacteria bacterium CG11_big_fil_rev_8_21_14_0_20_34_55]PIX81074.1 MAG: hypothetical protein COZ34_05155 [Candidatus Pacebacteria bacterium CG_4_10_14_3_um_filter_34_15]PJC43343.1 MAG: hypothetical protein CO0